VERTTATLWLKLNYTETSAQRYCVISTIMRCGRLENLTSAALQAGETRLVCCVFHVSSSGSQATQRRVNPRDGNRQAGGGEGRGGEELP
jgi:hypothetical protein